MRRTQPAVTGFEEGGRELLAKECRQPLEAEKGKETDFPLKLPERNASLTAP